MVIVPLAWTEMLFEAASCGIHTAMAILPFTTCTGCEATP